MFFIFKKIIFALAINSCLFFLLMIGIQNSTKKSKVNLLINQTVKLPIGFIVGSSFITGSIIGNFFNFGSDNKK